MKHRLAPERFQIPGGNELLSVTIFAAKEILEPLRVLVDSLIGPQLYFSESESVRFQIDMKNGGQTILS